MVHLAKYVLIKVTLAFTLHSLLFVKRSLNRSTAKQIGKNNGQPQTGTKVYCIQEENFEKERNPPKIYYFKAFLPRLRMDNVENKEKIIPFLSIPKKPRVHKNPNKVFVSHLAKLNVGKAT